MDRPAPHRITRRPAFIDARRRALSAGVNGPPFTRTAGTSATAAVQPDLIRAWSTLVLAPADPVNSYSPSPDSFELSIEWRATFLLDDAPKKVEHSTINLSGSRHRDIGASSTTPHLAR